MDNVYFQEYVFRSPDPKTAQPINEKSVQQHITQYVVILVEKRRDERNDRQMYREMITMLFCRGERERLMSPLILARNY